MIVFMVRVAHDTWGYSTLAAPLARGIHCMHAEL